LPDAVSQTGKGMAEEYFLDGEAQIAAFITKWDLDADAVLALRELTPDDQVKAFGTFAPGEWTQNPSGKFIAWSKKFNGPSKNGPVGALPLGSPAIRSAPPGSVEVEDSQLPVRTQEEMEGLAGPEAVAAFIERWSLDDTASAMLTDLPVDVRLSVLEGFRPASSTRNKTGKLKAYIASRRPDVPEVSKSTAPQSVSAEALEEFIGRLSLDEAAVAWLKELPSEQFAGVVSTFKPGAGTRDMTARLKAFAQARFPQSQNTNGIKQFVAKWGLDARSEELLRTLRPNVLDNVLWEFQPPLGTTNIGTKLGSFVRYASTSQYRPSDRPANGIPTYDKRSDRSSVPLGGPLGAVQMQPANGTAAKVGAKPSPELDELIKKSIKKWGLNEVAVQALSRLPPGSQTEALSEFDPPASTSNMSRRFIAFLRRRKEAPPVLRAVGASRNLPVGASSQAEFSLAQTPAALAA